MGGQIFSEFVFQNSLSKSEKIGTTSNKYRKFSRENHSSSMKFNMKFDFRIVCGPIVHWNKPNWIDSGGAAGVAWIDIGHKFPLGR